MKLYQGNAIEGDDIIEIKAKLMNLESAGLRFFLSTIWIFYILIKTTDIYQKYKRYYLQSSDYAQDYLTMYYYYLALLVIMVGFLVFFIFIDVTAKKRDRYLVLKDGTLFIPNSITSKVKEIKLEDIDHIGLEGISQEKVRISMKIPVYTIAPRIYNVYDKDIKDIYNTLNELLVTSYSKNN